MNYFKGEFSQFLQAEFSFLGTGKRFRVQDAKDEHLQLLQLLIIEGTYFL